MLHQQCRISTSSINDISKMRPPITTSTNQAKLHIHTNTAVLPTASLKITMTSQTKPKRRTKKYSAIKRVDGVITEHPRYKPTGSPPQSNTKFEKKLLSLEEITRSSKQERPNRWAVKEDAFVSIGAFLEVTGRDGYNDLAQQGGEEREELPSNHEPKEVQVEVLQREPSAGMTPMDRFLYEKGAWSSCSRREG
jgi:hypothetical protein